MSSLIFYTQPDLALVATDTLAVTPEGESLAFCSKAIYLPHLKTIIAGTGFGDFATGWAVDVNNRMILRGLLNLDYHTPKALQARWANLRKSEGFPEGFTTTVYYIGLSEESQEVMAFAYRSINGFQSELLQYGTHVKPECEIEKDNQKLIKSIFPMMCKQREIQQSKPIDERLYIGGECIMMHLTKDGCSIINGPRFDDYEKTLEEIMKNYKHH